jgi:hypothetical protein
MGRHFGNILEVKSEQRCQLEVQCIKGRKHTHLSL